MPVDPAPGTHRWGVLVLVNLKDSPTPYGLTGFTGAPEPAAAHVAAQLQHLAARWALPTPVVHVELWSGREGPQIRGWFDTPCPVPGPTPAATDRTACAVCASRPPSWHGG